MSFAREAEQLGPLEWFDPAAFIGDEKAPQTVCDLMLSLAVVYNDLRDLQFAGFLLNEVRPTDYTTPSRAAALAGGLNIGILRLQSGVCHELLQLIKESGRTLEEPVVKTVVRQLSRPARQGWDAVLEAATKNAASTPLGIALLRYRNKVAFHYDPKEIGRGYRSRFGPQSAHDPRPLLSRGTGMRNRRFFFADSATEAYLAERRSDEHVDEFLHGSGPLLESINASLYELVTRFVTARGFGWRAWRA